MKGYILKADRPGHHYFNGLLQGSLELTDDPEHAWFTADLRTASLMIIDLAIRARVTFTIVEHNHE